MQSDVFPEELAPARAERAPTRERSLKFPTDVVGSEQPPPCGDALGLGGRAMRELAPQEFCRRATIVGHSESQHFSRRSYIRAAFLLANEVPLQATQLFARGLRPPSDVSKPRVVPKSLHERAVSGGAGVGFGSL